MRCYVHVPLEKPLTFPGVCPFSGTSVPKNKVSLKYTSTSFILPLPGGFYNSYSTTTIQVPASRKTAVLDKSSEILIWISMLGGIGMCAWLVTHDHSKLPNFAPAFFLIGGLVGAIVFRVVRYFVLRGVRLKNPWNGFIEMHFRSESYARNFSELNRLALITD
jgi:hypothetical protein